MRVVLDTNVFVSAVFFTGPPARILEAWRDGQVTLALSAPILDEYRRVGLALATRYEGLDLEQLLTLLVVHSEVVEAPRFTEPACEDPDDEMFLECAAASGAAVIISGDKHLQRVSGWRGVQVLSPRQFVERYLPAGHEPGS